jgi:voltage-gated sodium channel
MATSPEHGPHTESRHAVVRWCARTADSTWFTVFIFAVIVANAIVLGLQTYDSVEKDIGGLLGVLDGVFLGIFVVELIIRIVAFGNRPQDFFRSGWNVFDFVVIAVAFLPGVRENVTLLRLARLARVVRVVGLMSDLRILVVAMGKSLPGVASLTVIGVLVLYVYGMVGWLMFGDSHPDEYGTIGDAMLTLFLLLSLETLPDQIQIGLEVSSVTLLYFISFVLIAAFLLLNILIGVVLDSLEEAREMEWRRAHAEKRRRAAETPGSEDDREVAVAERLAALRKALEELELEIRAGTAGDITPPPVRRTASHDRD